MRKLKILIFAPLILILLIYPDSKCRGSELGDLLLGLRSGYSKPQGGYASELNDSFLLGFSVNPRVQKFFWMDFNLSFAQYVLSKNRASHLNTISVDLGPLLYYPLRPSLRIFGAFSLSVTFFQLRAMEIQREENTLKSGFAVKSGLLFSLSSSLAFQLGYQYSWNRLTGGNFPVQSVYGAIVYGIYFTGESGLLKVSVPVLHPADQKESRTIYIEGLYENGVREFSKKNYSAAQKIFQDILNLDANHIGSRTRLNLIGAFNSQYRDALALIREKKYFQAIPLLEKSGAYLTEAKKKLEEIREELNPESPALLTAGIEFYEKKECDKSMKILNKVLKIQPDNERARIYFQKAARCYKATQKLK